MSQQLDFLNNMHIVSTDDHLQQGTLKQGEDIRHKSNQAQRQKQISSQ